MATTLFTQNIIACIWDFDKTLIPDYMQAPLFKRFGVDEDNFWAETNSLVPHYKKRGYHISGEIAYLNHLLTYVLSGEMAGLNNRILRECGGDIQFYPGVADFLDRSRTFVRDKPEYQKHDIALEHYVVSTGLAEMIRGSSIADKIDGVWACEFVENPLQPGFLKQDEMSLSAEAEIAQIGMVIDNTTKTKAIFEINKGTNRNAAIDVNSNIKPEDRRIPLQNMIYIADGPSDIPSFSVVKKGGGKAYAVYNPDSTGEFEQNDRLRQVGRIDHYGEADYRASSPTAKWLRLQIHGMCDRIVADREAAVAQRVSRPPRHLSGEDDDRKKSKGAAPSLKQSDFLDGENPDT
ncbi:haloacid dehalogenase-like hydrolase [Synoicihabitans lomoniglobus]|uniref:Haloacid dehalogenase-like hydrolase n=1 Tax=Synoicihabitans lomoniglobus TaxID=2909285 RepID=A0AAF0CQJ8_9BACT|nr:haloacid dehalogenase-like hydrolase [Opitutaceae bacterium LMO-M01]WED66234.1 haloacid dehalogenase-like hydrolase [Opitutaceae bacterium LMO-M01]